MYVKYVKCRVEGSWYVNLQYGHKGHKIVIDTLDTLDNHFYVLEMTNSIFCIGKLSLVGLYK